MALAFFNGNLLRLSLIIILARGVMILYLIHFRVGTYSFWTFIVLGCLSAVESLLSAEEGQRRWRTPSVALVTFM